MNTSTSGISTNTAFQLLSDSKRRTVLRHMAENDETTTIDQLVDVLSGKAASVDRETTRDQLAIALHHVHLPMLDEADVVEYDPAEKTVQYHSVDVIEDLLQASR